MTDSERELPTCQHGVVLHATGSLGVSMPIEARCSQCATAALHAEEREAIVTFGAGWIEGYTGDDLPEVAKALHSFLNDVKEMQHHV